MPFNVATIKDKAVSAKNATSERVQNTRDRYSSQPMSKTRFADQGYVPDVRKQPPPPPPARPGMANHGSKPSFTSRMSNGSHEDTAAAAPTPTGLPPPVTRGTKPGAAPSAPPRPAPPPMPSRSNAASSSPSQTEADGEDDNAPLPSASAIRARWQAQAAAAARSPPIMTARSSVISPSPSQTQSNGNDDDDADAPPPPASAIRARWQAQAATAPDKPVVPTPLARNRSAQNIQASLGIGKPAVPPSRTPSTNSKVDAGFGAVDKIDWANLSPADKQAFFAWLDEFFAMFLAKNGKAVPQLKVTADAAPVEQEAEHAEHVEPPKPPPVSTTIATVKSGWGPPPLIKSWSKPKVELSPIQSNDAGDFQMSYPPPTEFGSVALDLALFFSPSTSWSSLPPPGPTWYASDSPVPPPLERSQHRLFKLAMGWRGDAKHVQIGALFADLSGLWARVGFSVSNPRNVTERRAWTTPPPASLDADTLVGSAEAYGAVVAEYAEGFADRREVCARGECWDVANEALKHASAIYPEQPPVPSLGRTHGHLIFSGRTIPGGGSRQIGRWRGADDRIRRGDVVEWRTVRIGFAPGHGSGPGSYAILGDPEHTAVITADCVPSCSVYDGASVEPRAVGCLEVVEQSQGVPVKRAAYDLAQLHEGEVWIYRPVGMETYLGFRELEVEPPPEAQES